MTEQLYICDHAGECISEHCTAKEPHGYWPTTFETGTCDLGLCDVVGEEVECIPVKPKDND